MNRCANCWEPHHVHRKRMSAPPCCPRGGVYREATDEEVSAKYDEVFPDGPQPVATYRFDSPDDMRRLSEDFGPTMREMAEMIRNDEA